MKGGVYRILTLSPADINLPNNLFRWEPTYLQTLANQKAMTNQHILFKFK